MRTLDYQKVSKDIQKWIKNYVNNAKMEGVVLGISGGVDSSVVAALCINALGKENVIGVSLPCDSSSKDNEDADFIADYLGIKLYKIDLTLPFLELMKGLTGRFKENKLSKANLKPRLRMLALYYVAQSRGNFLVVGTGNRAEIAIGYFTKYGDGGVDFNPIGSLYKREVRELGRVLKLPERIVSKKASPGLWDGQTTEGEIGIPYDIIDEIVFRIDNNLDLKDISKDHVEKVKKMMKIGEHKSKLIPIFKIS